MHLLECCDRDIRLTEELAGEIPSYAILSHTWDSYGEEVTFQDMIHGTAKEKPGYDKIKFCATNAQADGLQYFWVDTCCIDKANSTELIEAINSMFICLKSLNPYESQFRASRWFTRGWTLQELLAPSSVEFFTREGLRLGDKKDLEQQIHKVTEVAVAALRNEPLAQFSTEERFRWAADRNITKEEDSAYCLLGIFGVYMPLIYGEGKENAVRRLKKEIAEATNCKDTPKTAQGIFMLPYVKLCALQNSSTIDLEILRTPLGGKGAVIAHNYRAMDRKDHTHSNTHFVRGGLPSSRNSNYVRVKTWICSWCDFGPLDWASEVYCALCGNPRDQYCQVGYGNMKYSF